MADVGQGLDWMGRTGVHYCAVQGDAAGLREALAGGADPGLADKAGMTPLHFAAQSQSALAAELLLAAGAMVDVGDRNGNTALFDAVFNYRGDPATLRVLLAAGADHERANAKGVSPRGLADLIGNYDVAVHVPGAGEDR
ncbi:ankyrin repeat domain-containing protein [Streptomyces sp. NPDC048623]|uniref:ankyrin repeat domain-containing protein n=1 Tax=Streptomyces sp. NPDC048623 TaxID=3155761 RepID=UPI003442EC43